MRATWAWKWKVEICVQLAGIKVECKEHEGNGVKESEASRDEGSGSGLARLKNEGTWGNVVEKLEEALLGEGIYNYALVEESWTSSC